MFNVSAKMVYVLQENLNCIEIKGITHKFNHRRYKT